MSDYFDEVDILASVCRSSFEEFCREFWETIPGVGKCVWNWHMTLICQTLQEMAERIFRREPRLCDYIANLSPGSSKSSLVSVLFPAWFWTRMPEGRIICGSHTDSLVLDLAVKARDVITSEKYQACFPEIKIRPDVSMKGLYANTLGGERKSCTIAGTSPTGKHSDVILIDDALDPKKALSEVELETAKHFFDAVIPSRKTDKEITPMFLVMQRLHDDDPTGHLLEKSKREGAYPIHHICLPAELEKKEDGTWDISCVKPPEMVVNYVDGLMDPIRLSRRVLKAYRADGIYAYSSQFLQSPVLPGGSMFREEFFTNLVQAPPYRALRIRGWDRAASSAENKESCYTAGILMSRDDQDWYTVEHCIHGRWEPFERNDRIVACAIADRARYGPNYEPIIYIERERGSTGEESFRHLARRLAGFKVREHAPSGAKEVRAEPWSDQLAAKNVRIVCDGTWDVQNYITEHTHFPKGRYKDQVDASAMCFTILAEMKKKIGFRSLTFGRKTKGVFKLIIVTREELPSTVITDHPAILISITNPEPISKLEIPESGITNLMGKTVIKFADADPAHYQERWNEVLPAYGRTIQEVIMNQDTGKQLWKFLTGRYPTNPECVLFMDDGNGDSRATSLAYAVCDVMGLKRKDTVYRISDGESMNTHQGPAPNNHVYAMVKATRGMIL